MKKLIFISIFVMLMATLWMSCPVNLVLTTIVSTTSTTSTTLTPDADIVVQEQIAQFNNNIYVETTGSDTTGVGSQASPYKTIAKAAQVATTGDVIKIGIGTFLESEAIIVDVGISLEGSGVDQTIIKASGSIPAPDGINTQAGDYKEWPYGSLIQLVSQTYQNNQLYGDPELMIAPTDGNQKISHLKLDGNNKACKAAIWVQGRNNISIHNVDFLNFKQRGLVVTRSNMYYYVDLKEGMWVRNIKLTDLKFTNCAIDLADESLGNLSIGGINGAEITNITISEDQGYGIKFIHVGHLRNVIIDNCDITVPEVDVNWKEDISIELWNLSWGNVVSNIRCNTWMSFVSHTNNYLPTTERPSNLKIFNVSMIDTTGASDKESIEVAMSGVEIYNSYFRDKGYGIAFWETGEYGDKILRSLKIHHNVFENLVRNPNPNSFGNSSAFFCPAPADDILIANNVFYRMSYPIFLRSDSDVSNLKIANNIYIDPGNNDVLRGNTIQFLNNLRKTGSFSFAGATENSNNINNTNPLIVASGTRAGTNGLSAANTYYQAASVASPIVNAGVDVGLPYSGSAPDIGTFEWVE